MGISIVELQTFHGTSMKFLLKRCK